MDTSDRRALWIRRGCRALLCVQAIGIAWLGLMIVWAMQTEDPAHCGLSAQGMIPFFLITIVMIVGLLLVTWAVMRHSERRYAWVALLFVAFITALPFTVQLMNWLRR